MLVGPKILIVDDHRLFSEALELLLGRRLLEQRAERAEFRRTAAAEGLPLVRDDGPFDLAIVDPTPPEGVEILGEIKTSNPRTRVAALGSNRDLCGALRAGADEAIDKDTPIVEMISRLACLAGGGGWSRRTTATKYST